MEIQSSNLGIDEDAKENSQKNMLNTHNNKEHIKDNNIQQHKLKQQTQQINESQDNKLGQCVQINQIFQNQCQQQKVKKNKKPNKKEKCPPKRTQYKKIKIQVTPFIVKELINYLNGSRQQKISAVARRLGMPLKKIKILRSQYYQTRTIKTTQQLNQQVSSYKRLRKSSQKAKVASKMMIQILKSHPTYSVDALRKQLSQRNINIKYRSLYHLLQKEGYSYQILDYANFSKNTPQIIQERYKFTQQLKNYNLDQLIYITQTTFNLSNLKKLGWVHKSQQHVKLKFPENPNNISAIAVANISGIIGFIVQKGIISAGSIFNLIIEKVLPIVKQNDVIIMNQLMADQRGQIKDYFLENKLNVKQQPNFSPQLNPLETFFSTIKVSFRRIRIDRKLKDPNIIQNIITELIQQNKNADLRNHFKKMRTHFRLAQKKCDFQHHL